MSRFGCFSFGLNWSLPHGDPWIATSATDVQADVMVTYVAGEDQRAAQFGSHSDCYTTTWENWLAADLYAGKRIDLSVAQAWKPQLLGTYLWGPLAGIVLAQRDRLALHANAVWTPSGVIIIAGPSGVGKSTLTAALVMAGCPLVSDDVVAIADAFCWPGPGRCKLWPSALRHLGVSLEANNVQALHPDTDKVGWRCSSVSVHQRWPIAAVVSLRVDHASTQPAIDQLTEQTAFAELMEHSLGPQLALPIDSQSQVSSLATLMRSVPVYRMTVPPRDQRSAHAMAAWLRRALAVATVSA